MVIVHTPEDVFIEANSLRLHYVDWGNTAAPPMLLLHGFTGHARTWDAFAQAMSAQYHVVALDQRGHGDSAWSPDGAYTVDDHAADIYAVHQQLGLGPVVLVGLSMGGRNAIRFSATYPQTVERLVIVDIGPDIDPRGAERVARLAGNAPETFADAEEAVAYLQEVAIGAVNESALRHRVAHGITQLPDGRYTWKYDAFLREQRRQGTVPRADLWPDVQQIPMPTLIVRGAESDIFAPETAQRMLEMLSHGHLVEIPGAGHVVPADAPAAFEETVRNFLAT